jgi:protein disulfide-isomerase
MKILTALTLFCLLAIPVSAADNGWLTNLDDALKIAEKDNKVILMDFSGSDWCGWCIKLDKEVFSQAAFKDYAKDNLVLVLVDFPRKKELPAAEKAAR